MKSCLLSLSRSEAKQTIRDVLLPRHLLQLFLGDPEALPGQIDYVIPPACSWSAWGVYSQVDVSRILNDLTVCFIIPLFFLMGFHFGLFCLILYGFIPFMMLFQAICNSCYKVHQNKCVILLKTRQYLWDNTVHIFLLGNCTGWGETFSQTEM